MWDTNLVFDKKIQSGHFDGTKRGPEVNCQALSDAFLNNGEEMVRKLVDDRLDHCEPHSAPPNLPNDRGVNDSNVHEQLPKLCEFDGNEGRLKGTCRDTLGKTPKPVLCCNYCRALGHCWVDHTKANCPALASLGPCRICKASGSQNHTKTVLSSFYMADYLGVDLFLLLVGGSCGAWLVRLLLNWDVWYGSSLSQLQNSSCDYGEFGMRKCYCNPYFIVEKFLRIILAYEQ
ncbi:unnamed protein product [Enterobius vermicularis]|uniref:Nanos-type domain-containing protein n=1 Tax=Enterobius vermicularis TaxID=51028 RepID=A0A0N4UZ98_ENTVE|nr:unnamed protein product [Enterobius vermicularis]